MSPLEIDRSDTIRYRRVETIVFADVLESVRITRLNADEFISRWRKLLAVARTSAVEAQGGRFVKSTGDGLCAVFPTPRAATLAAFVLHELARQASDGYAPERAFNLRIGAHTGEVTADDTDVYGDAVNLAARMMTLATSPTTVATMEFADQIIPDVDADIEHMGECHLKHLELMVHAYRIEPPGRHRPKPVFPPPPPISLKPTVAVVPFEARGAGPAHIAIGDIVAEDSIAMLSRSALLNVVSRLSSTVLRGRNAAPAEMAKLLGAVYIVSGTYRIHGSKVVLYAELADARNNQVQWADTMEEEITAVLSPANSLVQRLVEEVSRAVLTTELRNAEGRSLPTLDTYTLMMSAIALMHRSLPRDFDRSKLMLEAVIDRAPRHATPYAWLAKWHVMRLQQGGAGDPGAEARAAQDCIRRALDSDAGCSLALAIDGFINTNLLRKLDLGAQSYRHALAVNPNDSLAWLLKGTLHAFKGEGDEALEATLHARRLSPLDPLGYFYDSLSATAALAAHDWENAVNLAQRSLRANRTHTSTWRALTIAQVQLGRIDAARASVGELMRIDPGFNIERFVERSPSTGFPFGELCKRALVEAGVPTNM